MRQKVLDQLRGVVVTLIQDLLREVNKEIVRETGKNPQLVKMLKRSEIINLFNSAFED